MKPPYKNFTVFAGRIGNDPEPRYLESGDAVVSLRINAKESYKDAAGAWKQHEEWATVVLYRKDAEAFANSGLGKGAFVYVEGRRYTRTWQDGQGHKKTVHEIVATHWHAVAIAPNPNAPQARASTAKPAATERPAPTPAHADSSGDRTRTENLA